MKSKNLTVQDLKMIEDRLLKSSAGPWKAYIEGRDHTSGSDIIQTKNDDIELYGATEADYDFIANAKQDIPKLIEEINRLKKELILKETSISYKKKILRILHSTIVEIRYYSLMKENDKAYKLSNLIHNVPLMLNKCNTDLEYKEVYNEFKSRTFEHKLDKWFEQFE